MLIDFNEAKLAMFENVVFNQDFIQYRGMTTKYSAFEEPNLPHDIKMSILKKLSVTNHLNLPNFESFWLWTKKKHGTDLSIMLSKFISPEDEKFSTYLKNAMSRDSNHKLWLHIKARVYKKWCSIATEMQCVYAVVKGIKQKNIDWKIVASPELDAIGVDFAIIMKKQDLLMIYPIQIKKDSYNVYAKNKLNNKENFEAVEIKKKALLVIKQELEKLKINAHINDLTILKYGLSKNGKMPYSYLKTSENGFVYYDNDILIEQLIINFTK